MWRCKYLYQDRVNNIVSGQTMPVTRMLLLYPWSIFSCVNLCSNNVSLKSTRLGFGGNVEQSLDFIFIFSKKYSRMEGNGGALLMSSRLLIMTSVTNWC
jgi:hypothetical protein